MQNSSYAADRVGGKRMSNKVSSYRWGLAALTWLMMFALGASWFCFTPMMTALAKDMVLSYEQLGILVALVPLSLVIICIPSGLFADRFGIRIAVSIGGTIMGVFGLLRGFATDFTTLAMYTFLTGVGYSIAYPNLPKVTGIWFSPKEYALASGVMFTGMEVGIASSLVLTPAVLLPWTGSWQGVFITIGTLSLVTTSAWMLFARERPKSLALSSQTDSSGSVCGVPFGKSLSIVLRNRHMWILMLTTLFLLAPQIGLLGFLPTMLTSKGYELTMAGMITSMISWFMIPSSLIIPMVSDRVGLRKPFIWGAAIIAAVALYLAGTTIGNQLWFWVILYGFLIGSMAPIILAMPLELVGASYSGTAGGFILVGGYFGAMVAPWLVGYLSTATASFVPAVILCTAMTGIEAVFALMLKETGSHPHLKKMS
jgi:sugar phosphate permease